MGSSTTMRKTTMHRNGFLARRCGKDRCDSLHEKLSSPNRNLMTEEWMTEEWMTEEWMTEEWMTEE
jgi:hypothetical protein